MEYPEQKTPNEPPDHGMVQVTHPHHPLYKQTVKVLRRAWHPVYQEPCYLIELPDGTRAELPAAWTETAPVNQEMAVGLTIELWAGVSEFLALAAALKALSSIVAEEVADEKRKGPTKTGGAPAKS